MKTTERLSREQLVYMRELYISGVAIVDIADQFNVSRVTVTNHSHDIIGGKNGKSWVELRQAKLKEDVVETERIVEFQKLDELEEEKAARKDKKLSTSEKKRRIQLRQEIREVNRRLKLPKLNSSDFIRLSEYRLKLENELHGKDEVFIIGAPENPDECEFI